MNQKLLNFLAEITRMVSDSTLSQTEMLDEGTQYMARLVAQDDWLPDSMAQSDLEHYRQNLLYGDPLDRFSLVSFVWGPGQSTPVHDHTVWGVIGMLRGAEQEVPYKQTPDGKVIPSGSPHILKPGEVACVAPGIGDIHMVSNAIQDQVSISIHLYGGNIGRIQRHVYDTTTDQIKTFVSGYSNPLIPNLWMSQP